MMTVLLVMDTARAVALRDATAGAADERLDPREIAFGALAGCFALPVAVLVDPAFAALAEVLVSLDQAEIDPVEAWPDAA